MSSADASILKDFQDESKDLLEKMVSILDECEESPENAKRIEEFGLNVDRVMGGAKTISGMLETSSPVMEQIGDYAGICKAVAYKASQIKGNEQFFAVCVSFLQDATEVLEDLIDRVLDEGLGAGKFVFSQALIDRLKWLSGKFGEEYRSSVGVSPNEPAKLTNNDIADLLKKLGLE